jgi:hypothetical protein
LKKERNMKFGPLQQRPKDHLILGWNSFNYP